MSDVTRATREDSRVAAFWTEVVTSAGHAPAGHRAPEVVAGAHLLHEFALPLVLHFDAGLVASLTGDVGVVGELVGPLAVVADEDDAGTTLADVLDDRLGAAMAGGEILDSRGQCRIGTLSHDGQPKTIRAGSKHRQCHFVMPITWGFTGAAHWYEPIVPELPASTGFHLRGDHP